MVYLVTADRNKLHDPDHPLQSYLLTKSIKKGESFHWDASLKGKCLACKLQFLFSLASKNHRMMWAHFQTAFENF